MLGARRPNERGDVDRKRPGATMDENTVFDDDRRFPGRGPQQHAVADELDIHLRARRQRQPITNRFRNDDPPCTIDGNFHARMVLLYRRLVKRNPGASPPLSLLPSLKTLRHDNVIHRAAVRLGNQLQRLDPRDHDVLLLDQ